MARTGWFSYNSGHFNSPSCSFLCSFIYEVRREVPGRSGHPDIAVDLIVTFTSVNCLELGVMGPAGMTFRGSPRERQELR
jgi:hypothetical protein